jgi:hypothetical protein
MAKIRLLTPASMAALQSVEQIQGMRPKYLKVAAAIKVSGLSRTHLYGAMGQGQLKYAHIKQKGSSKGVRLIDFDSLVNYIESFLPKN